MTVKTDTKTEGRRGRVATFYQLLTPLPVGDSHVHLDVTQVYTNRRLMLTRARRMRVSIGSDVPIYELRIQDGCVADACRLEEEEIGPLSLSQ